MDRRCLVALSLLLLCPAAWAQQAAPVTLPQLAAQAAASPRDANVQYRLGRAYEQAGDLNSALRAYFQAHVANPADARTMSTLARLYAAQGVYERAAFWYRKLLALRPGDEKLGLEAARLALQYKQPLQAEALLKQLLRYRPDALDAWQLLGKTYESLKLSTEALACYEQVVSLRTPTLADQRHLIDLYLRTGQAPKALQQIRAALRQKPTDVSLQVLLGDCHLVLGSPAAAADAYEQAAKLAPKVPAYRLKLADALAAAGDRAAALAEYDRVILAQQPSAELLLKVAALAGQLGEEAAAQRCFGLLVALLPSSTEYRRALISAARGQGDVATALTHERELQRAGDPDSFLSEANLAEELGGRDWALDRLRAVAPQLGNRPDLGAQAALLLANLGETVEAAELAGRVAAAPSAKPEDRARAARALLESGQTAAAERALRAVLAADPRQPQALLAQARVLQLQKRWGERYDLLRGGFAANPRDEALALALVQAAAEGDRLEELVRFLRPTVEADPRNAVALRALSNAYRSWGGVTLAARELVTLSVSRPGEKLWALEAARELASAGRVREAAAMFETLARDPEQGSAARFGLCQTLLAAQRYPELLATLARLADPGKLAPEAFALLNQSEKRPGLQSTTPALYTPQEQEAAARAAAALYLAPGGSEAYYLALADFCLARRCGDLGLTWLQGKAFTPHREVPTAAGVLRLLRNLGRALDGLGWLDKLQPEPLSPRARLEEIYCLLAGSRVPEAVVKAEALLQTGGPELRAETHYLCGETLADTYRPEEAVWHYVRAMAAGQPADTVMPRLRELCVSAPFPQAVVLNALQEMWSEGLSEQALALAEGVAERPDYAGVRQWALYRARELRTTP